MKTPRELILERHQTAEASLLRIHAEDLAACARAAAAPQSGGRQPSFSLPSLAMRVWQELIWPWRRIWIGMAAVWLLLLALNLTTKEGSKMASHKAPRPSPELLAAMRVQRQMMLQSIEAGVPRPPARPRAPGPRSEQRQTIILA